MNRVAAAFETLRFIARHPTNRRRPVQAVLVFAGWQLYKRVFRRPLTISFWSGLRIRVHPDSKSAGLALYTRLPEYDDMLFAIRLLRPGDRVIDVGANVGLYSLVAAARVGLGRITALEPDPVASERLRENVALNGLGNVEVLTEAAGAEPGEARLTIGLDTINHILEAGSTRDSIAVRTVALDDLVKPGEPVALVKVDAEGFESAVLAGARRLLAEGSVLAWIVEVNGLGDRYGVEDRTLMQVFRENAYRPYRYHADERVLEAVELGDKGGDGWNVIFIKQSADVLERLEHRPESAGG